MKNMSKIEIEEFTEKYFPQYKGNIRRVSYIVHEDRVEYLVNGWFLFIKNMIFLGTK